MCPIPLVSNNKICSSQITCNITSIKLTETPISIPRFKCSGDQQRHTRPSDHQDPRSKQFIMVTSSTSQRISSNQKYSTSRFRPVYHWTVNYRMKWTTVLTVHVTSTLPSHSVWNLSIWCGLLSISRPLSSPNIGYNCHRHGAMGFI